MDMVFLLKCHLCVSLCFSCNIMLYFLKIYIYIYIYIFIFFFFFNFNFSPIRRFHFLRACFVSSQFRKLRIVSPFVQLRFAGVFFEGFYYLLLQFAGRVLLLTATIAGVFFEGFYYLLYLPLWVSSFD
jgi:hypothetical protein